MRTNEQNKTLLRSMTKSQIIDEFMIGSAIGNEALTEAFKNGQYHPDKFKISFPYDIVEAEFDLQSVNFYSFPEYEMVSGKRVEYGQYEVEFELRPFYKNLKEIIQKYRQKAFEDIYNQVEGGSDYEYNRDGVIQEFIGDELNKELNATFDQK